MQVGNREETETIVRYYNNISITGGNNYINNSNVELSTIAAGNGNDTIITGGGERNYLRYNYWYSSVVAGAGNNKITVNSDMTHGKIYSGVGNDFVSITGDGSENIVSLSGGNDSVITGGSSSTINVGVGNNFVTLNSGSKYNDIIAGNGNDYVVMNNSDGGNEVTLGNGSNTVKSLNGNESVYSGIGNDYVTIAGGYASVGDGKNKVSLTAAGDSTVIAGSGDDVINVATVEANRNYDYIDAGAGNNYINNSNVELSTIVAGNGNDTIITGGGERNYLRYNYWYSSVVAGAGNNKITVNSDMTRGAIYAGSGNDFVSVSGDGSENIISVGDGRNTIVTNHYYDGDYNYLNTIESGKGSDLIYTSGNSSFINAGSGRNYVSLGSGYYNTVLTGKGNDTIELAAENSNYNKIIFDGGKDIVYNYNSGDTIASTSNIDYYTLNNDVIVTNGKSSMTLKGAADKEIHTEKLSSGDTAYKILVADKTVGDTLSPEGKIVNTPDDTLPAVFIKNNSNSTLLSSTVFNDVIENKGSKVTVQAFSGNDQINNRGSKVSIVAGNGNDTVDNLGVQVTIDGGAGRDYLENYGKKVLIEGGDGNDLLSNYGARVTINGGKGNDTIRNYSGDDGYGDSVIITGGTGNDYIYSNGDNILYKFVVGDGKDTIDGFNSSSLLQISGGTGKYTQKISSKNTVITVGKESITLKNTKGKNIVIDGNYIYEGTWRLNGTKATYGSENKTLITVNGVKSLKGISLKGNVVTVSKNSLSTSKVTVSKGYTLALGSDITKSKTTAAGWSIKGTTATYKTKSISAGYTLASDKKSISYTKASGGATKITLSGLKSSTKASYLTLKNNVVTISKNAIGTGKITAKGDGYKFVLGSAGKLEYIETKATLQGSSGNDIISGGSKADTIFGGKGNDTLTGSKGSDIFIYANGDGKDIITDYSADDKIKITKGSISKAAVVGKNVVFTIGSGSITVQNGKGQKISIVDSNGKTTTKTYAKLASSADLIADDNFITANSQLDSILNVNKNYSADKLELSTNYGLMQNDSLQTVFNSKTDF